MGENNSLYPDLSTSIAKPKSSYPDLSQSRAMPEYKMPEYAYATRPPTPDEVERGGRRFNEGIVGASQGVLNIPSGTAQLLNPTSYKIPRFDYAPKTTSSRVGQVAGTFLGPAGLELAGVKALSLIPNALNKVKKLSGALKSTPFGNSLLKAGRSAAEVGYVNALNNPDDAKMSFIKGAALGGPIGALAPLAVSAGKYAAPAAKAGIGALIGSQVGHPYIGAATGSGFPVRGALGMEPANKISEDMLSGLNEKDVMKSVLANRRLGTNVTPGEASGNYVRAAHEGSLKRTAGGGQLGYRLEETEKYKQNNAINRMLDKIYKPSKENENKINSLYQKAYHEKNDVDPTVVAAMMQNPVMRNAIEKVQLDPAFENVAPNNYKFLSQVNRTMRNESNQLANSAIGSERISAHHLELNRKPFDKFLKENNPEYKAATEAAHGKLTREEIERKGNKELEDLTAKTFYSRFLNNRKPYQEILRQTNKFPEAQQMIKDMRSGWKNLSNMKTASQSESQAKSAIDNARNLGSYFITLVKNMAGSKGDIARLKFIYSPTWEKGFADRAKIADKAQRMKEISSYMTDTALKAGLGANQVKNLISILDEKDE